MTEREKRRLRIRVGRAFKRQRAKQRKVKPVNDQKIEWPFN